MHGRDVTTPVGRDHELELVRAAIDDARAVSVVSLALLGSPGSGKTTVWRAALDRAEASAFTCLTAAPTSLEAPLAYAVLGDLLAGMPAERLDGLPPPQRIALRAALQLEDPGMAVGDHATAAGLRTLLAELAREGPLCIAIDDLQWADLASRRALAFATRRLEGLPVLVLLARRPIADEDASTEQIDWPGPSPRLVELAPLSVGAMHHVLRAALGATFPRPTLVRIATLATGNPLLAIEIGRAVLDAGGDVRAAGAAALEGATVRGLLGRRMAGISDAERRTLLVGALVENGSMAQAAAVHEALGWPREPPPADAGLATFEGAVIRFHHPLYAEAALAAASSADRRAVHWAVAERAERVETRARHLAEATDGVDEVLASTIDDAVRHAAATGAHDEARELARLAVERTPPESALLDERVIRLADLLFQSWDRPTSTRLLEDVLGRNPEPATRVAVLLRLATVWTGTRPSSEVRRLCLEALQLAKGDRVQQARARLLLADTADAALDRLSHARAAVAIIGPDGPSAVRAEAMNAVALYTTQAGRRADMQLIESAVELEPEATDRTPVEDARFTRGWLLLMDDELDRARADFRTVLRYWQERGNEPILATILAQLGHLELRAGNWPVARHWGLSMLEAAERSSQRFWTGLAHAQLAALAAVRGDEATAVEGLAAAERIADEIDDAFLRMVVALNRAMRALAQERFEEADQLMAAAREQRTGRFDDPGMLPWAGSEVEAAARAGHLDRAILLADDLERRARRMRRRRALGVVQRGRAIVAATRGDLEGAIVPARASVRALGRLPAPFEEARSLLVLGSIQRRRREKRQASDTLTAARDSFERLGAGPWSRQASEELRRIGLRPRAPATLTDSEALVARLAAGGSPNRAIASAVFLSPKTVEATLGRVYLKLGIRGRAELGVRLAALGREEDATGAGD